MAETPFLYEDNIVESSYLSFEISAFDPNVHIQLPGREMISISIDEVERMSHDDFDDTLVVSLDDLDDTEVASLDDLDNSEVVSDDEFDNEFEMIVELLGLRQMENEVPNKPTSKTMVENLQVITVTKEDVEKNDAMCVICKDDMGVGEKAKLLPCSHRYHGGCIDQWLEIRNTCPVCRYEFPMDDPESEKSGGGTRNLSCEVPE